MYEICPKLTRKTPHWMSKTKFLQICSFSLNLIISLSFSLVSYVISIARLRFSPWFPASLPWFHITHIPCITMLIFCTRICIPFLTFHSFRSPIPHFGFYRQSAQFAIFKNLFYKNSWFIFKKNTPLCYYCVTLGTKLLFTSSKHHQCSLSKLIYLLVLQVKNL